MVFNHDLGNHHQNMDTDVIKTIGPELIVVTVKDTKDGNGEYEFIVCAR